MSPIYEYSCPKCERLFERIELSIQDIPTSQCPLCLGVGTRVMSIPSVVCELFNESHIHKLPDWQKRQAKAKVQDARTRKMLPPIPGDRGMNTREYAFEFGKAEMEKLNKKAQLDNI